MSVLRSSALAWMVVVTVSHRAAANPKVEAGKHVDKATALFNANKPAEALDELKTAYALDPRPELLYAIGQTYLSLGQCADANTFYQRFLATKPAADSAKAAKDAMAACKNKAIPEKDPEPIPEKVVPPPPPEPPTTWYSDHIADGLVGAGLVSGIIALIEYRAATNDRDRADRSHDFATFSNLIDSANHERAISIVAGIAGAALAGGGIAHYVLHTRHSERHLQVTPIRAGAAISWGGRF